MGAINFSRISMVTAVSEILGYKSGLALSKDQLLRLVPESFKGLWLGDGADVVRIRSEEFEQMVVTMLYGLGAVSSCATGSAHLRLTWKYRNDPEATTVIGAALRSLVEHAGKAAIEGGVLDASPVLALVAERYGTRGLDIFGELLEGLAEDQHRSVWSGFRAIEWQDEIQLSALFESEDLAPSHGSYVDQRFINYLHRNFESIDDINWRKFEGLACEYFEREGFHVEIGQGRNDGGIDARIWSEDDAVEGPPTILVQCKRQKKTVGLVIVKALWADIYDEQAKSGMIVTTSRIAPGARRTAVARAYPIEEAGRVKLREWLHAMRSPDTGVFMGE